MPRVSTFCPRCGEAIETEVPDEARAAGRAELTCPACRFDFVIAPARAAPAGGPAQAVPPSMPGTPPRASGTTLAPRPGRPASFKPTAAAMMLFFAALVGIYLGSVLTFQDDIIEVSFEDQPGNGNFTGSVHDSAGRPLANATVTLFDGRIPSVDNTAAPFANATTDAAGRFRFGDIPLGIYTARIEHPEHRTVLLEAPAYPSEYEPFFGDGTVFGDVEMRPGDPADVHEVSVVDRLTAIARWMGAAILAGGLLAVAGGVAALRRRFYPLAILGAVGAVVTWGFFLNMLIGLIAGILIILARKEFRRRGAPA